MTTSHTYGAGAAAPEIGCTRAPRRGVAALAAVAATAALLAGLVSADAAQAARPTKITVTRTLEKGDRGRAVAAVQRALGITVDRVFGPKTHKAVRRFQKRAGLSVDGKVGPQTRKALNAILAARALTSRSVVLRKGDHGPAVVRLQRALRIRADGFFGKKTRKAVKRFQRTAGLTADGIVGPATLTALARKPVKVRRRPVTTSTHTHAAAAPRDGFDPQLAPAIALAERMGLDIISGYRPGAIIGGSGNVSDHAYFPSKAVDVAGSAAEMKRYALAVAELPGVDTIIYAGTGLWLAGRGWGAIRSSGTYRDHIGHVHVDTF